MRGGTDGALLSTAGGDDADAAGGDDAAADLDPAAADAGAGDAAADAAAEPDTAGAGDADADLDPDPDAAAIRRCPISKRRATFAIRSAATYARCSMSGL